MKKYIQNILKYLLSLVVVVVSVYYATKGIDFSELGAALQSADYKWAIIPIPIMLLSHWIRALRWKTMLKPILEPKSTLNLFSAVMVGYAFNNILPRGGEFIRPYVYSKREKVSYSSVFATIIVERIIDVVTLLGLFALSFLFLNDKIMKIMPDDLDSNKLILTAIMILAGLVSSFYAPFVDFMLRILIKPFSQKIYEKIQELFVKFRQGFAIIKRPSQYFRLIIESLLIWFCYALPLYIMFFCFNFQSELNLGLGDALLLLIGSGIAVTLAPSPGAIGIFHVVIQTALFSLYGIPKEIGLAYATINHGVNFLVQVVTGGAFFLRERISTIPNQEDLKNEMA